MIHFFMMQITFMDEIPWKNKNFNHFLSKKTVFNYIHTKNSSIKLIEVFKSCGYRHLWSKVLENSQNISG